MAGTRRHTTAEDGKRRARRDARPAAAQLEGEVGKEEEFHRGFAGVGETTEAASRDGESSGGLERRHRRCEVAVAWLVAALVAASGERGAIAAAWERRRRWSRQQAVAR